LGDPTGDGPEVSHGIISALDRSIAGAEAADGLIETDDPLAPGESGGPLLDGRGRVIGVNTVTASQASQGLGLAIPINLAREVALQLVAGGKVQRGFLGVTLQDLTEDLKTQFGASRGALVAAVAADGPASRGGLKGGDVIVRVNGAAVADTRHLQRAVNRLAPGREVALEVLRSGRSQVLRIKLGVRPGPVAGIGADEAAAADDGVLDGVTVADLTAEVREALHLPVGLSGAVITEVAPESASAAAGLRPGDVITELDRQPVATADEAVHLSAIIKGPKVMVRVWRGGGSHYVVVDEAAN
jgi:serine protease Do